MEPAASNQVYRSGKLPFKVFDLNRREEPLKVLMADPAYFDIIDVKNVHMEGQAGHLNKSLATQQWQALHAAYLQLMEEGVVSSVEVIPGAPGCEDMVFCANQTFPWLNENGKHEVWMSKMRHPSRQQEVPYFEAWFNEQGYQSHHFYQTPMFEGMGDTIPHPGRRLLYGGFGHRTDPSAYEELSEQLKVPVVALELVSEHFYHLDTCFVPLSETAVMLCKEAFSAEGFDMLKQCFETIYEIPLQEAVDTFALNAHVIHNPNNGKKAAIVQKGSVHAKQAMEACGYKVIELETGEFMKSGGSVFCMKMMYY